MTKAYTCTSAHNDRNVCWQAEHNMKRHWCGTGGSSGSQAAEHWANDDERRVGQVSNTNEMNLYKQTYSYWDKLCHFSLSGSGGEQSLPLLVGVLAITIYSLANGKFPMKKYATNSIFKLLLFSRSPNSSAAFDAFHSLDPVRGERKAPIETAKWKPLH